MKSALGEPSAEVYKSLIEHNPDGILLFSVDGLILEANQAASNIFGYSSEKVKGQHFQDFLIPEYIDLTNQQFAKAMQGADCEYETHGIHKSGETVYIHVKNIPAISNGEIVGAFGVLKDITKQKQVEKSLTESENRYQKLVELSPIAMIVHRDGLIQYANRACRKLLGASSFDALIEKPILDFSPPEYRVAVQNRIGELDRAGIAIEPTEEKIIRMDGKLLDVEITGISIQYDGKPSYLMIIEDITKEKRAEEALRNSEEKYRLITESMSDLVGLLDANGVVKYASPSHKHVLGLSPAVYEGSLGVDSAHPDDKPHLQRAFDDMVKYQTPMRVEFRLKGIDGRWLWIETHGRPVVDEDSNPLYFLVVGRDITDRKQAEETLRQSEERYRLLAENSSDLIFVTDSKGEITYASPSFEKALGIQPRSVVGTVYLDLADPTEVSTLVDQYHELLSEKKPKQWLFRLREANGESIPVECNVTPMLANDTEIVSISFVARDIRHRIEARKELEDNEKKYSLIANNSSDLIRLVNVEGVIIFASPSHFTFLGIESERYIGKSYLFGVHPDDLGLMKDEFQSVFTTRKGFICEYRRRRKDGLYIWVESTGTPVFDERGNITEIVMVARDITERKINEKRLEFFALHDVLTELPNRRLWKDRLDLAIREAERHGRKMAVMMIDIDRFKSINDRLGHDVGDELLKQFAYRVQCCLRESDTFARQGGDEFTILLPEIEREQDAVQIAQRILSSLQKSWRIGEHRFTTTSSIGVAFYPSDANARRILMKCADEALYAAKENGRNTVKTYSGSKP